MVRKAVALASGRLQSECVDQLEGSVHPEADVVDMKKR